MPVATDIDISVVGTHVAHTTAQLAMEGEYSQARLGAISSQRLLQKARWVPLSSILCILYILAYIRTCTYVHIYMYIYEL